MAKKALPPSAAVVDLSRARHRVRFVDFASQYEAERDVIHDCVETVFRAGQFVDHPMVGELEAKLAGICGTRHAIALSSGTTALQLAMTVLGIGSGDEVIVPPNSHYASAASIAHAGATPVFADVRDDQNIDPAAVEAAVTPRTKAIMPVHLTGRIADMNALRAIAERHALWIVEDAAQSIGSLYHGQPSGGFGDLGCFSAHPLKNLNAAGDAGYVTTNDANLAARLRRLRNHGLANRDIAVEWGYCARMDVLQAAILNARLTQLPAVIERRRAIADLYRSNLDSRHTYWPPCQPHEFNTFHLFVIQVDRRDELKNHLARHGIETAIHYPKPLHLQPAAATLGYEAGSLPMAEAQAQRILSLPVHQFLTDADILYVCARVNEFYGV